MDSKAIKKTEVILVTGMSGAGKSTAMTVFENMKYYCIDNYPVPLLNAFADLLKKNVYAKVAMAVSLGDAIQAIRVLSNIDWINLVIVFLECDNEVILSRYKQTRRSHPMMIMNRASTLSEAIELERKEADQVKPQANVILDTSLLKVVGLQDKIEASFNRDSREVFRVVFESFGYKLGVPKDADVIIDVRFLPNPFYIEELRTHTGNDKDVYDFVIDKPETQIFIKKTTEYLDYLLNQYEKEGKMQVIIGVGCTGGQHRSVTLANYLSQYYSQKYSVYKYHRDAVR